jgi:hypothetical protein
MRLARVPLEACIVQDRPVRLPVSQNKADRDPERGAVSRLPTTNEPRPIQFAEAWSDDAGAAGAGAANAADAAP